MSRLPHIVLLPLITSTALSLPAPATAATCTDANLMPQPGNLERIEQATRCLINVERRRYGRPRLVANAQLASAAQGYADRLVSDRFFSHVSPDGGTLLTRIRNQTSYLSHTLSYVLGENLAWGSGRFAPPSRIVSDWMGSPGHRRNILARRFKDIGLGVTIGAPQSTQGYPAATYVTEFGRRG